MKLVRRECGLSLGASDSLFRALAGDIGSFSTAPLDRRLVKVGTANFPGLSVVGGPIDDEKMDELVPVLLCGDACFTGG